MEIKAVGFDADGTLFDSAGRGKERLIEIVGRLGYPISEDIHERIKKSWAYGDLDNQIVQDPFRVSVEVARHALEMWKDWDEREPCDLIPGAARVTKMLQNAGFVTAILTSRGGKSLSAMLHYHGIQWNFNKVFYREKCFYKKPHARAGEELLDELWYEFRIRPENFLYWGDIPGDMRFSVGAGVIPGGVTSGLYSAEDLLAAEDQEGHLLNIPRENIVGSVASVEHWLRDQGQL